MSTSMRAIRLRPAPAAVSTRLVTAVLALMTTALTVPALGTAAEAVQAPAAALRAVAPTAVTTVSPDTAPVGERQRVTLLGRGLGLTRSVTFGGVPGTALTVASDREVRVTAPAITTPGPVPVQLVTYAGRRAVAQFTYLPDPVVSTVSPPSGSTAGGTAVTVTGEHLAGAQEVTFGDVPASDLTPVSPTELRVVAPARVDPGRVPVRVRTATGWSAGAGAVGYRYARPPAVTAVLPPSGAEAGGTLVTIDGADLAGTTSVTFAGVPADIITVTPTRVRVKSPARSEPGAVPVTVTALGGDSTATPAATFRYAATPVVGTVTPTSGAVDGGTEVTLRGTDLAGATAVTFGGVPGTDLVAVSDTELRVRTPLSQAVRDVDVRVTTLAGTSPRTGVPFAYVPAAAQSAATPGPAADWVPLGLIGLLSWSVWFVRRWLSHHRYRPVVNDFRTTTSVVVPVYREDPDVLERCLRTWVREGPTEVVLVVDDRDAEVLHRLYELDLPGVQVLEWRHTGKRGALGAGVRAARGEVVVFADSDTEWRPGLLAALQMPFADPRVGGVGSRQHVYAPDSNLWRRVAYWLLNSRYLDYVPAMSARGGVACLSGRTAAYRHSVIRPLLPALEHERFLGRECVAGDDGRLTWLVLAAGYRTVHQDTAEADSMFPAELRAFVRQRVRWSRNSYRCYLTAASQGWLWRQPLVTQVTVLQILLTPVTMGAAAWYAVRWAERGGWLAVGFVVLWTVLGRALRGLSHLRERPHDLALAPLMAVVVAGISLPVKTFAALTMNKQGWLTRVDSDRVQGQHEIEVVPGARVR